MTRNTPALSLVLAACLIAYGCGDDGSTPTDTGAGDAGSDAGGVDCETAEDGTDCGGNLICVGGACQPSICGDGYVDEENEACDDGNSVPGDGCEPENCQLTCAEDVDCDDGDPCNGIETCSTGANRCQAGVPESGVACEQPDGSPGVCSGVLCAAPGCGNGAVDGDEECDDGANGDNDDGCRDDCQYTCDEETPCNDGNACNGEEMCNLGDNTCTAGTAPDCDDRDPCTSDSCDEADGCANVLIDGDGDNFAPGTCRSGSVHRGGDCDDADPTAYPGAPEACDGLDNDCDRTVDNDTVDIVCQRDADGDGYGNASDTMTACSCPSGYIAPHPGGNDCHDGNASVNPGVTTYYTGYYCPGSTSCDSSGGSWDWNCSGSEEKQYNAVSWGGCGVDPGCSGFFCFICSGSGWLGSVPDCGQPPSRFGLPNYRTCTFSSPLCSEGTTYRRQSCR